MAQTLAEGGRELCLKALEAVKRDLYTLYADESELLRPEWQGGTLDILTVDMIRFGEHLDRCIGEYYFRPVPGDPGDGQLFTALITLRNDVPLEHVPELAYALGMYNFYIETGCFALNKPADMLVYKSTRTFPGDTSEEALIRDCILLAEEAYETASKYCTPLFALAEGSMDLPAFFDIIKT